MLNHSLLEFYSLTVSRTYDADASAYVSSGTPTLEMSVMGNFQPIVSDNTGYPAVTAGAEERYIPFKAFVPNTPTNRTKVVASRTVKNLQPDSVYYGQTYSIVSTSIMTPRSKRIRVELKPTNV